MITWQAHKARIRQMAFAPDGAELGTTAGSSKFVWLWHAPTGEPAGKLEGHTTYARSVAYSPDGKFLASTQNGAQARVWERASGKVVAVLNTSWCVESIAFRPDSSAVALPVPNSVGEWPVTLFAGGKRALTPTHRFGKEFVNRVCFSPCGRYLAAGRYRGLSLYDAVSRQKFREFSDPQSSADAAQIAFAPDGNTLAVVYGLRIHLFAMPEGKEIAVLRGHPNFIHAMGFLPDNRSIVSAGADGVVRVWDANSAREARSFDWGIRKVCAAAVSPDGLLCAAGGENGKVVVWDVDE